MKRQERKAEIFKAMGLRERKRAYVREELQNIRCIGYRRILVEYVLQEKEKAGAYLLIPETETKKMIPAIVCHRHAFNYAVGKSEPAGVLGESRLNWAEQFCRMGMCVICPDYLCFEGRRETEFLYPEKYDSDSDEIRKGSYLTAEGSCMLARHLMDLSGALDVLKAYCPVQEDSVLAAGYGMGGRMALWLALADGRISSALCAGGITLAEYMLREERNIDMAFVYPGMMKIADYDTAVSLVCPKELRLLFEKGDENVPEACRRKISEAAERAYAENGCAQNYSCTQADREDFEEISRWICQMAREWAKKREGIR